MAPIMPAILPAEIESAPRLGPTVRSSTMVRLAGRAPARNSTARSLAPWTVKLPEIWPVPPRMGSRICGRGNHLVVEDDGEQLADILLRCLSEALSALGIEAERHDRFAGALVERCLRVDEIFAGNDDAVLDQIGHRRIVGRIHDRRAGRRTALDGLLDRNGLVDHLEGQLCRLAENVLQPLRVLQARHLHQDAVRALALDDRLGGAEFVDAPADHLDRLGERGRQPVVDAFGRQRVAQQVRLWFRQCQFGDGAGAEDARGNGVQKRRQRFLGRSQVDRRRGCAPAPCCRCRSGLCSRSWRRAAECGYHRGSSPAVRRPDPDARSAAGCANHPAGRGRGSSASSATSRESRREPTGGRGLDLQTADRAERLPRSRSSSSVKNRALSVFRSGEAQVPLRLDDHARSAATAAISWRSGWPQVRP